MDCMRENFREGELLDGRFETVAPLNHGSFGMVFLANDLHTGNQVAMKCITKRTENTNCPAAFAIDDNSEELICHTLLGYHPNIVNLVHHFETDSHRYLVLEYCSMGDLYEAIKHDRGPLETEHVREFMLQLIDAVEHMHSRGLYHRDIKPENIFLSQDGSVKLGDFGLATQSSWSYESAVGSDRYMAPEQYDNLGNGYSPAKADVWSIGICLLNILFSRNPFTAPAESDKLFADYRRDRQSLFDLFPNLSQDTFEILIHAMAIDPEKRSISAVRDAIVRAVTFTTDDELFDDYCTEDRDVVQASANREPLRTPSIQSPQTAQGDSFPWAKALRSSPKAIRQLSVIPDESYGEDLFPASEVGSGSWFSRNNQTPSLASVLDSTFGASLKSNAARPTVVRFPPRSDPVPITGSLPSRAAIPIRAMSSVFGKKTETVSKSWSDLWDEEEEEEAMAETNAFDNRREMNSRTWSQESRDEHPTVRPTGLGLSEVSSSVVNSRSQSPAKIAAPAEEIESLQLEDVITPVAPTPVKLASPSKASPPSKRSNADKWSALGDKRRKWQTPTKPTTTISPSKKKSMAMAWRRDWGLGSSGFDYSAQLREVSPEKGRCPHLDRDWRQHDTHSFNNFTSFNNKFNQHYHDHQRPKVTILDDHDDAEWVGGWHDLHL